MAHSAVEDSNGTPASEDAHGTAFDEPNRDGTFFIMLTCFIILTDLVFTGLTNRSCSVRNSTGHAAAEVTEHSLQLSYPISSFVRW